MGFLKQFFRNVLHEGEPTTVNPSSFEDLSEEELAKLVDRDAMIGVTKISTP